MSQAVLPDPANHPGEDFASSALANLDGLYRSALRLAGSRHQAEDLVQETYLRAFRYRDSYRTGTNLRAWLFAIMRNLFWDRYKPNRHEVSLDETPEFALFDRVREAETGPEAQVLDRLASKEVLRAIDALGPLQREVVLLVDVEEFSYKEAAEILSVPIGTVMSRLHRARQTLQRSLWDYALESGIVGTVK